MTEKKCLIVASVSSMIGQFILPNIELLLSMGYHITVATNFTFGSTFSIAHAENLKNTLENKNIEIYEIQFYRNIFDFKNIIAYRQIRSLIAMNNYSLIHCHSPIGGVITRLAARKKNCMMLKVMYTVHGFHFYKKAPFMNWLLYYPVEKFLSKYTDVLITMNQEDYNFAGKKLKVKNIYNINGVGIDVKNYQILTSDKITKRRECNIPANAMIIISVGELIKRKNHQIVIETISKIKNNSLYYIICGQGKLKEKLFDLCRKHKLEHRVLFLGYRDDIIELLHMSDIFLFPSIQEGLPVALMEAMAAGLPCIASRIRGNVDLIVDGKGGILCDVNNIDQYADAISKIALDNNMRVNMGEYNRSILKKFDVSVAMNQLKKIYEENDSLQL